MNIGESPAEAVPAGLASRRLLPSITMEVIVTFR